MLLSIPLNYKTQESDLSGTTGTSDSSHLLLSCPHKTMFCTLGCVTINNQTMSLKHSMFPRVCCDLQPSYLRGLDTSTAQGSRSYLQTNGLCLMSRGGFPVWSFKLGSFKSVNKGFEDYELLDFDLSLTNHCTQVTHGTHLVDKLDLLLQQRLQLPHIVGA
jgi:hypothetical protein